MRSFGQENWEMYFSNFPNNNWKWVHLVNQYGNILCSLKMLTVSILVFLQFITLNSTIFFWPRLLNNCFSENNKMMNELPHFSWQDKSRLKYWDIMNLNSRQNKQITQPRYRFWSEFLKIRSSISWINSAFEKVKTFSRVWILLRDIRKNFLVILVLQKTFEYGRKTVDYEPAENVKMSTKANPTKSLLGSHKGRCSKNSEGHDQKTTQARRTRSSCQRNNW